MPVDNPTPFKREECDDRVVFAKTKCSDQDTRWLTSQIPVPLLHPGVLSAETETSIGYFNLDTRPRYVELNGVEEFFYRYFTAEQVSSLGLSDSLQLVRQTLLRDARSTVIDLAHPFPCEESSHLAETIAKSTTTLLKAALPEHTAQLLYRRCLAEASMCAGWEDNCYTSSIDAKLESVDDGPESASSMSARELEVSTTDDPCRYSVIIFLSNISKETFPGRFCLASFREYCITSPFSALVFKRTLPYCTIRPSPYGPDSIYAVSPPWVSQLSASQIQLQITSYPAMDRMRQSVEAYSSWRAVREFPLLFGTLQNYSEWLFRVAFLENSRRSDPGFGFSAVTPAHLAQTFRFRVGDEEFSPRIDRLADENDHRGPWEELESRIRSICAPFLPCELQFSHPRLPIHTTHNTNTVQPAPPSDQRYADSTGYSSRESRSVKKDASVNAISIEPATTRGGEASQERRITESCEQPRQSQPPTDRDPDFPKVFEPPPSVVALTDKTTASGNSVSTKSPASVEICASPLTQPPIYQAPAQAPAEPIDTISTPTLKSQVSPCSDFTLALPEWCPGASLTQTLNDQIRDLFSVKSLRSAIDKFERYQKLNLQSDDVSSPLTTQLQLHLQVLRNGSSPLHGYEHLVSRASICSIIQKAPELKQEIITDLLTSDLAQRLSMSAPSGPEQSEDAFWKDFQDRNLLLCQIVQTVGSIILLAPGLYRLILTAGGKSAARKSAVRSSLQPAVRSRIVEACLWSSQNSLDFMSELQAFWHRIFQYHPLNEQPACRKLHQTILPFVPSPGPCFRTSFPVLHQIIEHALKNLSGERSQEDIIWGRPHDTDRLLCIREAGLSMRSLECSELHKDQSRSDAQTVFRNVLSFRTLFFGNPSKMRSWSSFKSAKDIEKLVALSSVFDEPYGQSRSYGQYQFPSDFKEFQQRLRSCWRADWPIPSRGSQPSWAEVHSAASNADGAGEMLRSLIASDMARLGWSDPPEHRDWSQLLTPASASALGMLFPSAPRTFGSPARRHLDPALAEVVAVSLSAGLDDASKQAIGFDRIFVEHLLSRFYVYFKEGWISRPGKERRPTKRPKR